MVVIFINHYLVAVPASRWCGYFNMHRLVSK